MVGMLQILTYLICFHVFMSGVTILQIALSSPRERRKIPIMLGIASVLGCTAMATYFANAQDEQAAKLSKSMLSPFTQPQALPTP